jgi:hypothetical protein
MERHGPPVLLHSPDDLIAAERGRLWAAMALAQDAGKRKEVEDKFGIEYCKQRWPEVYAKSPFFKRLVDKIRFKTDIEESQRRLERRRLL